MTKDEIRDRLSSLSGPMSPPIVGDPIADMAARYDALAEELGPSDTPVLFSMIEEADVDARDAEILLWRRAEIDPQGVGDFLLLRLREKPTPAVVNAIGATGREDLLEHIVELGPLGVTGDMEAPLVEAIYELGGSGVLREWQSLDALPVSMRSEIERRIGSE